MTDSDRILQQAQSMQGKLNELQRALQDIAEEGQSGGGLVRATLNAKGVLVRIAVDVTLLKPENQVIVEDLIVAAHADAKAKLDAKMADEVTRLSRTLGMPLIKSQ